MTHLTYTGTRVTMTSQGTRIPAGVRWSKFVYGDRSASKTFRYLRKSVAHIYRRAGTYTAVLRVMDRKGHLHTRAVKIAVKRNTGKHGRGAGKPKRTVHPVVVPPRGALPAQVDLSPYSVTPGDQGSIGSCVTWAIDYGLMGWYARKARWAVTRFAPMYTYSQYVKGNPNIGVDEVVALRSAKEQGVDSQADYPGWQFDYKTLPTAAQRANARNYRIASYRTVFANASGSGATTQETNAIKSQLASGYPMTISMWAFHSLSSYNGKTYYRSDSGTVGGHEVLALGYNKYGLLIENSWGAGWGSKGYGWLAWSIVSKDVYAGYAISGLVGQGSTGDHTSPTVTAPVQRFVAGSTMSSIGEPVRVSWAGADNSGAIASYDLYASTNGGAWSQQALSPSNATSITYSLVPGSTYRFAVRSRDAAGNVSSWAYGPSFGVANFQENSSYVHYTGTGWRYVSWNPAEGGQVAVSSTAGDTVSFTFTGQNAAWVTELGSNQGRAYVYTDGVYQFTVDLYSPSTVAQRLQVVTNFAQGGTHTIKIDVEGTSGRPNVGVDSFALLG